MIQAARLAQGARLINRAHIAGTASHRLLHRGFSSKPARQLSRKPSKQLPSPGIMDRWATLGNSVQVLATERVPAMMSHSRLWTADKLKKVASDPTVLLVWTVAGFSMLRGFVHHMWVGSKLLVANTKIATRLLRRAGTGKQLTRSQQKLLVRTSADLLRLIPFSFFVLVPFMELLLPVALKVFPNMIPSTFASTGQREAKHREQYAVKIDMAHKLRDLMLERVHLVSLDDDKEKSNQAVEFAVFLEKMKRGVLLSHQEITQSSKFFRDQFTIDGMSRSQLNAMAELMNIGVPTYAPIELLRFQIRRGLRIIQADDRAISWEGVEHLSKEDLVEANDTRGMASQGLTQDQLRKQLSRWLLLSMNNAVPPSLLILSRTFVLTNDQSRFLDGAAIASAIKSIPRGVKGDIQEELLNEENTKREKRFKQVKTDEQVLDELKAADQKATEDSQRLDEMVEQDRLRTSSIAGFETELAEMNGTLSAYELRLKDMNGAILEALRQTNAKLASGETDADELESRLAEKSRLEQAVHSVEAAQEEFKEKLVALQGDVHSTNRAVQAKSSSEQS